MAATTGHIADRVQRLTKYLGDLKSRLSTVPAKFKGREHVFVDFITLEIRRTEITLNSLKG